MVTNYKFNQYTLRFNTETKRIRVKEDSYPGETIALPLASDFNVFTLELLDTILTIDKAMPTPELLEWFKQCTIQAYEISEDMKELLKPVCGEGS